MSESTTRAGVIIPAGGSGLRMGGERKQFRLLGGRPLLLQTIFPFLRHEMIGWAVVAVPEDAVRDVRKMFEDDEAARVRVVEGGLSRQESVLNGLRALPPAADVVLVHDAVRPFVAPQLIDEVLRAVMHYGSAAAAVPVSDTLRRGSGDFFEDTLERHGVYRMQTPQGFRRHILEQAHDTALANGTEGTDEVSLVQACGHRVMIVEGDPMNVKLTTPADWAFASALWPWWQRQRLPSFKTDR